MTVELADLVELPCSPDMISAGIAYTCHAHLRMFLTQPRVSISHLRRLCAQSITSLAMRRWLTSENIPHHLIAPSPLTHPHFHQITIGGRPMHVVSYLISNRDLVRKYGREPHARLGIQINAADKRRLWPHLSPGELLVFSFLLAKICLSVSETRQRIDGDEHAAGIAIPPYPIWRQQNPWRSLGRPILYNAGAKRIQLEINGLLADRSLVVERVSISARQSVEFGKAIHNLLYLCTENIQSTSARIESPNQNAYWQITPGTWSNLWFYEPCLLLAGWLTKDDADRVFQTASRDQAVRQASPKARVRSPFLIRHLRPIGELIHRSHHM